MLALLIGWWCGGTLNGVMTQDVRQDARRVGRRPVRHTGSSETELAASMRRFQSVFFIIQKSATMYIM
jgi:hypothetical protein